MRFLLVDGVLIYMKWLFFFLGFVGGLLEWDEKEIVKLIKEIECSLTLKFYGIGVRSGNGTFFLDRSLKNVDVGIKVDCIEADFFFFKLSI